MKRQNLITLDHKELSEAVTDYLLKIKVIKENEAVISTDIFDTMDFEICRSDKNE